MLETAAVISGGAENVQAIGLYPGGGAEDVESALRNQIAKAGKDAIILCLVDIPGGSPARVAAALALESSNFHVVSGLNIGMLTETLMLRASMDDIARLKEHIMASAVSSVMDVGGSLLAAMASERKGKDA